CCATAFRMPPVQMAPQITPDPRVVRDLFLRSRGRVDITAARVGTGSWGDNVNGGVFTRSLHNLLMTSSQRELDTNRDGMLSWNEFFPRLQSGTEKAFQDYKREWEGRGQKVNANDQTPQAFEIRVENAPAPENHT